MRFFLMGLNILFLFSCDGQGERSQIESIRSTAKSALETIIDEAKQAYRVVRSAVDQANTAVDENETQEAVNQATVSKDKVVSAKERAEEIFSRVQTLTGGS